MLNKLNSAIFMGALLISCGGSTQNAPPSSTVNLTPSEINNYPHLLKDPKFTTFVQMAKAAGIIDLFQGTGPFTGFIPNNDAFKKLGAHKLNELLKPENQDKLASILMFHIVPGKYLSNTLKTENLQTINGKELDISVENGKIKVNNANVIRTDIIGPNGVVHEIDTVLFP